MCEGAGCITWWGFSPARDLLAAGPVRHSGEVNILLVGSGDPRHILKTISCMKDTDRLHVWVIESSMELVARQLLLLYLSLTPPENTGHHEKTEVFLEVFGNSELRCQTEEIVRQAARQLSLSVNTMLETAAHPCLDTTQLKFKERDELARIFRLWAQPPAASASPASIASPLSIAQLWDHRVRQHLQRRYDTRTGAFDWDLTMKLHQRGAAVIGRQQYVRWRERGLAFELREGIYERTNASLLSHRVFTQRGTKLAVKGYWGDIVSSPYLSFGIESEDKKLLEKQNGAYVKNAQDISFENVQALFQSLSCRGSCPSACQNESAPALMCLDGVSVTYLSVDALPRLATKQKHHHLFNTVYFAASLVHRLDSGVRQMAAPDAVLVVELARFLLDLNTEQEASFTQKVLELAKQAGFEPQRSVTPDDVHATFTLQDG